MRMARGDTLDVRDQIQEYRDEKTGALVRRLTADGSDNDSLYFTSTSFVGEGSDTIVFRSDRTGGWEFYMLEIGAGRLVQVTQSESGDAGRGCVDPGGRLFYHDGRALKVVDLDDMSEELIYTAPEGTRCALPSCTADGSHVAFTYVEDIPTSTESGRIYSTMGERYYQHPFSMIIRVDTSSGEAVAVWGERMWFSHVIIHPRRPDLALFCHEGGSHVDQRMWTVDLADGQRRKPRPLYHQHPGESCCHEYFTQQGEVGFQSNARLGEETLGFNCFVRPDGAWLRQFLLPGPRPGHIQSNSDNTLIIGDRAHVSHDDPEGGAFMSLITHENGRGVVRRLCRHDTSWLTQTSHPHPTFSPDDRWGLYSSDAGGACNVYMVDVTSI